MMTAKREGLKWVLGGIRRAVWVLGLFLGLGGAASAQVPTSTAPAVVPVRAQQQRPLNVHEQQIVSWLHYGKFAGACSLYRVVEFSNLIYAACGDAGLWLIRGGPPPMLIEARSLGGRVVNLYEQQGRLIATVLRSEDLVVAGDPAAEAPTSGPKTFGRVMRQQGAEVAVDLGAADGLNVGQQILFLDPTRPVPTPGWYTVLAVGVVSAVKEHEASVRMGLNETVPTGAFAQRTSLRPSAAVVAPPRPLGWAVRGALRPFLAVNGLGGGVLAELALDLRLKAPFHFSVNISPMGFAAQKAHGVGSFTGYALVGYDTRYAELGLGVGAQTINYVTAQKPGTGTVFPMFARIGAVDGFHLSARADLTLIYRDYVFGSLRLDARAPVAHGTWLDASVGFGKAGYTLAELSLRRLMHGNGHAGSTFLNLGAGVSGLTRERCHDPPPELGIFDPSPICQGKVQPLGIHLAAGLERRF